MTRFFWPALFVRLACVSVLTGCGASAVPDPGGSVEVDVVTADAGLHDTGLVDAAPDLLTPDADVVDAHPDGPDENDAILDETDTVFDETDTVPDENDTVLDETDAVLDETTLLDAAPDLVSPNEDASDANEDTFVQNDAVLDQTDTVLDETDTVPDETDTVLDETDTVPDETDTAQDQTDAVADESDANSGESDATSAESDAVLADTDADAPPTDVVVPTWTLTLVSGGGQSAWVDADLPQPVVLLLTDTAGQPVIGADVTVVPPTGALATPVVGTTGPDGHVAFALRLPLQPQANVAFAFVGPQGAALTVTAQALAPEAGTVFTAVGLDPPATATLDGPGTVAQVSLLHGLAVDTDGTVYFSQASFGGFGGCRIAALSPTGQVSVIAGTGPCTSTGDDGPATAATLASPAGLAIDRVGRALYIAETGANRVRRIDLVTGTITTAAGSTPGTLASPTQVFWGPGPVPFVGSTLYISDDAHQRIAVLTPSGDVVTWLGAQPGDCGSKPVVFAGCGSGCHVVWDTMGRAFVSGAMCGTAAGVPEAGLSTDGIVRVDAFGGLTHIAGNYDYDATDGGQARRSSVVISGLAMDAGGNVLISSKAEERVRRIDGRTGVVSTILGAVGNFSQSGNYVPGGMAGVKEPEGLAIGPQGQLYVADDGQLRVLWQAAADLPTPVTLVDMTPPDAAAAQDAPVTQVVVQTALVAGGAVAGVPVRWTALSPGAGVRPETFESDPAGQSALHGRVGLQPGVATFRAEVFDLHGDAWPTSPLDVHTQVTPVASQTVFNVLAIDPVGAAQGVATLAKTSAVDVVASADGHLYVAVDCGVLAVDGAGVSTWVAGNGETCTFALPTDQAQDARLWPGALALDDANHHLYVGDAEAGRVVRIHLSTGTITLFGGGGTATKPPYGDAGPATDGTFGQVTALELGNGGLFVGDTGRNQVRFIASDGTLSTLPIPQADCFWGTGCETAPGMCWLRDLAWDPAANRLLISAPACGPGIVGDASTVLGWSPGDTVPTRVAGQSLGVGSSEDGTPLLDAAFGTYAGGLSIGFDPAGTLHLMVAYAYDKRFRKVDNGQIVTIAGVQNGQPNDPAGDYGPFAQAEFQTPTRFTFVPPGGLGTFAFIDGGRVRVVW